MSLVGSAGLLNYLTAFKVTGASNDASMLCNELWRSHLPIAVLSQSPVDIGSFWNMYKHINEYFKLMVTTCFSAGVFCAIVSHPADSVVSVLNKEKGSSAAQVLKRLGFKGEDLN